jgi:HSP20 family protein
MLFPVMLARQVVQAVRLPIRFFAILFFIMAVTKVSSTVHFVSRRSAVSGRGGAASGHWVPNTDVYTTDTGLVVKVELPGMKSDNLEITMEGNRLRISGNRPDACRAPHCSFLVMEISYGPFESVLDLPSGYDMGQAKAIYVNGFLRIDVPAAHQTQSKTTKVPIADGN